MYTEQELARMQSAAPQPPASGRAALIASGALIDLAAAAPRVQETLLRYPLALSPAAYALVAAGAQGGAVAARLERLVRRLAERTRALRAAGVTPGARVDFATQAEGGRSVHLKALCGPGDGPALAITVLLPQEELPRPPIPPS